MLSGILTISSVMQRNKIKISMNRSSSAAEQQNMARFTQCVHTEGCSTMTPTLLLMEPPLPFPLLCRHHGYNDAGYRGSRVNPKPTQRSTCICFTYACYDVKRLSFFWLFPEGTGAKENGSVHIYIGRYGFCVEKSLFVASHFSALIWTNNRNKIYLAFFMIQIPSIVVKTVHM